MASLALAPPTLVPGRAVNPTPPSRPRALVLLNPKAGGGLAERRWRQVTAAVAERFEPLVVRLDAEGTWRSAVTELAAQGVRAFIAAGGDGTVSALVDALCRAPARGPLPTLTLGAVGLGSSNDFHKPFGVLHRGIPVRLRAAPGGRRDVCRATWLEPAGRLQIRHFLTSASVGATADANARFNRRVGMLAWVTRWSPGVGIAAAALTTVLTHRSRLLELAWDGQTLRLPIASLNAQKTPFVSGALRLDTPAAPDDGVLGVNVCSATSRLGLVSALVDLARGRFGGRPDRHFFATRAVDLTAEEPFALELDGEVVWAKRATLEVLAEGIGALT